VTERADSSISNLKSANFYTYIRSALFLILGVCHCIFRLNAKRTPELSDGGS